MSRPAPPRPVSLRLALHVLAMVAAASIATAPLTAGDGPAPSPTGNTAATRPAEAVQVEIPLRHLGRTLVVDARAGEETLELVVGTGREETVLTREAASRVAAAPAADASQGEAELAVLALGPAAFGDIRIQIAGRDELGNLPASSDGFLGLSLFSRHRITLDLPGMRLLLGSPGDPVVGSQTAGRPVGFSLEPGFDAAAGGLPTIPVQIAGETHRARLDTGTPAGLTLPARYAATLPLLSAPGRIGLARTSRGEFAILGSTLDGTLEIAGQRVERPRVWFSELYDTATVGLGVLEPFALVLDMPGRTVRLERPETGAHRRQQLAAIVPGVESRGPGLREAFNADAGKVRLLLILSPTWPGCIRGARVVLDSVLQQVPSPDLAVHVVWTPVLPTDSYEEARRAHILLPDPRARFYWDADQDLGLVYGRTVDLPRGRDLAWDIYFVFGPEAVWEETVPVPDAWSHQLGQDARHLGDGTDLRNAIQKHLPEPEPRSEARPAGEEATVTLQVGGMQKSRGGATWFGWPEAVRAALEGLAGIMRIDLDLKADAFTVTYRPRKVQPAAMLAAIRALGFEATVLDTAPAMASTPGRGPAGTVREISPGATVRNLPPAVAARLQEAQAAGRLALLEFHATWCAPCRVVEREVLPHPRVMAALAGYEMVRLDMDSPGGERAAHILQVEAMPALLVLDGCGRERERFLGVPDPEQLARRLGELAAAPSPQCPARSSR